MRQTGWTPSIVPKGDDQNVYLLVDDFGRNGRAYRETDVERADLEAVILDLLEGQYKTPSASSPSTPPKAGRRMSRRISPKSCGCDLQSQDVSSGIQDFVERHEGRDRQLTLRLA